MISFLRRLVLKLSVIEDADDVTLDLLTEAATMLEDSVQRPPVVSLRDAAFDYSVPYETLRTAFAAGYLVGWRTQTTILLDRASLEEWKATTYRPGLRLPKAQREATP